MRQALRCRIRTQTQPRRRGNGPPCNAPSRVLSVPPLQLSGKHAALEHLVGNGCGHPVDERSAHLRVALEHLYRLLLSLGFRMASFCHSLLPKLLATRLLVLLHEIVSDHVHDRVLSSGGLREQQRRYHRKPKTFVHGLTLASSQAATGLSEFQDRRFRTQGMVLYFFYAPRPGARDQPRSFE